MSRRRREARRARREAEPAPPRVSRETRWLLGLLALAFVIKLVVVGQLADHPLLQADAGFDTTDYVALADQVRGGNFTLGPGLYYVSPLYVYFLAAAFGVLQSFTAVRVLQAALGTLTIGAIFLMARTWYGSRAAWWAAGLAALTGLLTFHEILILQSSLDAVLAAAALLALTYGLTRGDWRWGLAAGVAFGVQVLNRPNIVLAAAAIAVGLVAIRRVRLAAALAIGGLLAVSPVVLRNVVVSHELALVSSHGGLNFYIGNSASANGFYWQVPGIRPSIAGQAIDTRRVAEAAVGHSLTDTAVSDYFFDLGWSWIRTHPRDAAWLFVRKFGNVFNAHYVALPLSYGFFAHDMSTWLAACFVGPWLLIPLALVGFVAAAPSDRRREYFVWLLFVPAYAAAVAVFFIAERYRVPLLVTLCVGAGAAIDLIVDAARKRRRMLMVSLGAAVASLAIAVNWPNGTVDGRDEDRMRYAEYLATRGQFEDAELWVANVVASTNNPAGAHARFGSHLLNLGRGAAALVHYRRAHELKPDDHFIELGLGQALLDAGHATEAAQILTNAIEHGAKTPLVGYDLARALAQTGRRDEALRALALVDTLTTTEIDRRIWLDIGRFARDLGAPEVAARFVERGSGGRVQRSTTGR
ncbi:MAG TPA: glycosyltransferase family 39 protein [Vicinamibacterales bacterium]|nr:glycosyltransferase family 39 protein [Vicinamibacterales bacterium]